MTVYNFIILINGIAIFQFLQNFHLWRIAFWLLFMQSERENGRMIMVALRLLGNCMSLNNAWFSLTKTQCAQQICVRNSGSTHNGRLHDFVYAYHKICIRSGCMAKTQTVIMLHIKKLRCTAGRVCEIRHTYTNKHTNKYFSKIFFVGSTYRSCFDGWKLRCFSYNNKIGSKISPIFDVVGRFY